MFSYAPNILSTRITLWIRRLLTVAVQNPNEKGSLRRFAPFSLRTMKGHRTAKRLHKSDTQTERILLMAQRNSTQTCSNLNQTTCVSPQGHESSPKNDISLFRSKFIAGRKTSREAQQREEVVNQRLVLKNRLDALRCFTRKKSAKQLRDVESLKTSNLFELVKSAFTLESGSGYELHELYQLIIKLNDNTWLDKWFIRFGNEEVIVFAQFGDVYPGIRFSKRGDLYIRQGFNFDIRLKDSQFN